MILRIVIATSYALLALFMGIGAWKTNFKKLAVVWTFTNLIGSAIYGAYWANTALRNGKGLPIPAIVGIALAILLVIVIVVYIVRQAQGSKPKSTTSASAPAGTQTTAKSGGALKTIFVLVLLGTGGWFILKPVYEQSRARSAERERRKLPVTLACDPTKYNTELLSGRAPNEWVITNVNSECDATEKVAIPLERRQIRTDSRIDIEMRLFGPNNTIIRVDGADPDGWFVDGPTMRINAPGAIAVQLRNKTSATKSTLLASS